MPCAEPSGRAGLLLVAAGVPALCGLSGLELSAWMGAVLLSASFGPQPALRGVGFGWIAAVLVPGTPPASVAAAGALGADLPIAAGTAVLCGAAIGWLAPAAFTQPGVLLTTAGLLAAGLQQRRRA